MRIGIVNDVPAETEALVRAIGFQVKHQVVWVATSGAEAIARCAQETPDVVLMALLASAMDGVETTRRIMSRTPCAILMTVSGPANAERVFEAMGCGALDAIDAPTSGDGDVRVRAEPLLAKLAMISRLIGARDVSATVVTGVTESPAADRRSLVAIGASAGGPAAVAAVLGALPRDFPASVVVIQHVEARFAAGMASWLHGQSALPVHLAVDGERLIAGHVLLAGTGDHLELKSGDRIRYTPEPRDYSYRPSVDVFFHSVAQLWRGKAVGVLLTGMGKDGAEGLRALRRTGYYTIAQDEASCAVYGMPKAAATLNAAVEILPLDRIASRLFDLIVKANSGTSRLGRRAASRL